MKTVRKFIGKLRRDEKGVTALEYGLLAALIAAVIIVSVQGLGSTIDTTFSNIDSAMSGVNTPSDPPPTPL